jgi:hypothetical protein
LRQTVYNGKAIASWRQTVYDVKAIASLKKLFMMGKRSQLNGLWECYQSQLSRNSSGGETVCGGE